LLFVSVQILVVASKSSRARRLWKARGSAAIIEIDVLASLTIVWNRALSFPFYSVTPPFCRFCIVSDLLERSVWTDFSATGLLCGRCSCEDGPL
jgi:hypothetical protein